MAVMFIQYNKQSDNSQDIKKVLFRDIFDCYLPNKDQKENLPKGWDWYFILQTREREFKLIAKSLDDRNMWMSGFRYLIASTMTVQAIMKENDQKMEQKMKLKTE